MGVYWCRGAKHTWIGRLTYEGYTFDSDDADPLQFMVTEKGYIYVKGKGMVTMPDGKAVKLDKKACEEECREQLRKGQLGDNF
jgi:hypothetical protein